MHLARLTLVASAAAAAVALILPFLDSPLIGDRNGLTADAWPAAVLLAVTGVAALLGDRREGFPVAAVPAAAIINGAALVFSVAKLLDALEAADALHGLGAAAAVGVGAWALVAATSVGLAGAALAASRTVR